MLVASALLLHACAPVEEGVSGPGGGSGGGGGGATPNPIACDTNATVSLNLNGGTYTYPLTGGSAIQATPSDSDCAVLYCEEVASDCSNIATACPTSSSAGWSTYNSAAKIQYADGTEKCLRVRVNVDNSPATTAIFKVDTTALDISDFLPSTTPTWIQSRGYVDMSFNSTEVGNADSVMTIRLGGTTSSNGTSIGIDDMPLDVDGTCAGGSTSPACLVKATASKQVSLTFEGVDAQDQPWIGYGTNSYEIYLIDANLSEGHRTFDLRVWDFDIPYQTNSTGTDYPASLNFISSALCVDNADCTGLSTSYSSSFVAGNYGQVEGGFISSGLAHFGTTDSGPVSSTVSGYRLMNGFGAVVTY